MARIRRDTAGAGKASRPAWLTAIYIRLSREDGSDESYSVKNQRQRLKAYFDSIAPAENMELRDIYVDDGYTGTDSNRDGFQRMLRDLDEGRINCILVKDLSRLSRNDWECKRYLQHLFVVKDVRFISLELPRLDSYRRPDEIYDLGVTMQSAYNENHCRETSIKVRGTLNAKRKAGEFIGAFAPYGYQKDPADKHRLLVDPESACVVREVFHWFVREGVSKAGIVKKLAALGIPCPAAYKQQKGMNYKSPVLKGDALWSAQTITQILSNQMYLGHMVQGKQRVKSYKVHTRVAVPEEEWFIKENTHEAIVDADIFAQAQALLQRDTRTAPGTGMLYPFSGFLRCADCGKAMVRRKSKAWVYYACRTYTTCGTLCSKHSMRHDKLERMVLAALQQQIDLAEGLGELLDEIHAAPAARTVSKPLESALKQRRQELERAKTMRTGLYMDWKNGDITREEYHGLKQELEAMEERLGQDIARLEEESRSLDQDAAAGDPFLEAFRRQGKLAGINRGIVSELIKVIYIHEGGDIQIEFNFADPHRRAGEAMEDGSGRGVS